MKKSLQLTGLAVALMSATALPASADVVRYATGNYKYSNVVVTAADGRVLRVVNTSPGVDVVHKYTDTIGIYGGGETASGRRKAKARAVTKALNCNWAFYLKGKNWDAWTRDCLATGVTVTPADLAYQVFEELFRARWCVVGRQVATQHGIAGPVYLSANVGFFGDASGTEEDLYTTLGSLGSLACY